jgi:signal transduction histidine kinase
MRTESQKYKGWLREYRWFLLLEGVLAAGIFYVDLSQELGVTAGVLYVALVLVALWARQKRYVWGAAVLGTLLTVLGYWLSPPGGEFWKVVLNRVISLLVIWATAFLCYLFKINEETLEEAHSQLEDQFRSLAKKDAELEFSNRRLEEKVEERTQKLKATNLFLEHEVKKNLQANRELETLLAELENMNVELKNFAHVVSHDLKEPLRGINYNAQWLQDEFGEVLGEKGKKFLNRLTHNTDRMYHLINDILQFAEVGNTEELSVPVSSGELVESVVRVLAPQENIEIEIQQPMPEVGYPPIKLKQIFQNLIVNGVRHFGKPTGKIVISCAPQSQYWCFKVWDNGQGIHEKHFARIFEMFQSLDRKESPDSTGIGLALVKRIVEQNGGDIQVESEFGEYTCFSFTVPKIAEKGRRNDA